MFGLSIGQLGLTSRRTAAWNESALWPTAASKGLWISPRTTSASFQESTGVTALSAIGTVADSSNPLGLQLDYKLGAPVLGAELVDLTPDEIQANWTNNGDGSYTSNGSGYLRWSGLNTSKSYQVSFRLVSRSAGSIGEVSIWAGQTVAGSYTGHKRGATQANFYANAFIGTIDSISLREIPGIHLSQSTSTSRPLASAKGGQTVAGDGTYDATGYPIYSLLDGADDALASATFPAGTLSSSMDCLMVVRRDSAASVVAGLYNAVADATKYFGMAESGSGSACVGSGAGTPTVWVDGTQLTGGTAVTRATLHTALTAGAWHILELRGLDLSAWTALGHGLYTGYAHNGGKGDIELFESGQDANRDRARARLAAYYGVTLP